MSTAHITHGKEDHHPTVGIYSYSLKIGKWKKKFRAGYYKTLIAEALNCTVHKGEFKNTIVGYLISERRLCLVLRTEYKKVHRMLNVFYGHLKEEMEKSIEAAKPNGVELSNKVVGNAEEHLLNLFTEYELKNAQLIKLITGRKVRLPYTDQQLERLKERIRNYPFCSAIDYSGGESPVLVKIITNKDWGEYEHLHAKHERH